MSEEVKKRGRKPKTSVQSVEDSLQLEKIEEEKIVIPVVKDDIGILDDGKIDMEDAKRVLSSKTIWANLIAFAAFFIQSKFGYVMDEATQAQALAIINIGLRYLTSKPIVW